MKAVPVPPEFAHAVITATVRCRRCGYNLLGQRAEGKCPECGLSSWLSVLDAVDPDASRLPNLRNPRGVGAALWWLSICMLVAGVAVVIRPVIVQLQLGAGISPFVPSWLTTHATLMSTVAGLLALVSVVTLAPPRGEEPSAAVGRDIAFLSAGLLGWAVLTFMMWQTERRTVGLAASAAIQGVIHLALAFVSIVTLLSVREIMTIIGDRSREYRTAVGGRQRIRDIVAAIAIIAVGELARMVGDLFEIGTLRAVGTVVIWICCFMVLVGLGYLVVNTGWIRKALRQPRPTFGQVLLPPLPDDTTISGVSRSDDEEEFEVLGPGERPSHDPDPPAAAR